MAEINSKSETKMAGSDRRIARVKTGQKSASAIVGHIFRHDPDVAGLQDQRVAGLAHEFRCALNHSVALAAVLRLHLAGSCHREALLGAALRLQFGHERSLDRTIVELHFLQASNAPASTQ